MQGKGLQVSMDPENKTRHKRDWREIAPISSVSSVLDAIWSPSDLEQWIVYPYTPHLHYVRIPFVTNISIFQNALHLSISTTICC